MRQQEYEITPYLPIDSGQIAIESRDQFVPLYLACMAPGNGPLDRYKPMTLSDRRGVHRAALIKQENYNLLYEPMSIWKAGVAKDMKEYFKSFPDLKAYSFQPRMIQYRHSRGITYHQIVLGGDPGGVPIAGRGDGMVYGLGLLGRFNYGYAPAMNSQHYVGGSIMLWHKQQFIPWILVVVKAKHINYCRAAFFMQQPVNLPLSDIKIMRSSTSNNNSAAQATLSELRVAGVEPEYVSDTIMTSYLFAPNETKSKELYLADAKQALAHPRKTEFVI